MSKLLIEEPPLQVLPTLATRIGLGKAILLQQVHYWCINPKIGIVRDGKRWIRNTAEEWQKDNFPFWSLKTVKRTIAALEEDGLLLSRSDLNKSGYDRTKWYTINHEVLNSDVPLRSDEPEPDDPIDPKWVDASGQYDPMEQVNMTRSLSETTTETTTETTIGATLPASQAQPLSLQDELMTLNGTAPTVSPRTEKKERKPREPKVTTLAPNANNYHREMFTALATLCKVDPKLKHGQLNAASKRLREAGYDPASLDKFANWWYSQDFRGQQGKPPSIGQVEELILQATQWVPWTPPAVPAKKNGPGLDALRSWHYQYCYEQWNDHVAASFGLANPNIPGAFRDWYDNEARIPDDQLADWHEQQLLIKSKEMHQW